MSRNLGIAVLAAVLVFQTSQISFAQGSFDDLLSRVPGDANALIIVQVDKVRNSGFAKSAGGLKDDTRAALNGHAFSREHVARVVLASELDLASLLPVWEIALAATTKTPSASEIARIVGGRTELFGDIESVWLPVDAYLVLVEPRLVGIVSPADRQRVGRWARKAKAKPPVALSPYLRHAASYPEAVGTEIIMALDLQDAVSPSRLRENLRQSQVLADRRVDVDQLADLMASVQGITLGIRVMDRAVGKLRIDFARDPTAMADFAKPLILEKLADLGAAIDDFQDWTVEVKDNTIYFGGTLSVDGLRRILSIVEPPAPPLEAPETQPTARSPGEQLDPKAQPSLRHFQAVQSLVDDVRRLKGGSSGKTIGSMSDYAFWLEKYARKIDELPILNVDGDLLDYSAQVAGMFRAVAGNYRGAGIYAGTRSANLGVRPVGPYREGTYYRGYGYGGYRGGSYGGYAGHTRSPSARTNAKRMGTAAAAGNELQQMRSLEDATVKIRRLMTERYQIEF